MAAKFFVEIVARNKDGYEKVVLDQCESQVWKFDSRLKDELGGMVINPKDFPEMVDFQVRIKSVPR